MGWNPVKDIQNAGRKIQQNVIDPIRKAPEKVTNEVDRGLTSVGNYPTKLIGKAGEYVGSAAGGIGQAVGSAVEGATPALQGLVPIAQDVLGALNPNEYLNRKSEFETTPIITTKAPDASNFDFEKILPILIAGAVGFIIFKFINKRK